MRVPFPNWLGGLALAAALAAPAHADSVAEFYKGKSVTLIAGYSAGGGFDLYSRVIANYLGKHIPGQPRIVVQNMPGAGSLRAASHVYNVAPKDGTIISLTRAPVIAPLLGSAGGAAFDVTKFTWLGSGASDLTVCALLGNPKINSMADAVQHPFTLGGLGPGSDEDMYTKILRKLLGFKAQLVSGYPGGAEMVLAVERGELDGRCGWAWSSIKISRPEWIAGKKIKVLNVLALERSTGTARRAVDHGVRQSRPSQADLQVRPERPDAGTPVCRAARHSGGSRHGAAQGIRRYNEGPGAIWPR